MVMVMNDLKIQQVWNYSYADFLEHHIQSQEQLKTSHAIQNCKTGMLGATISQCTDCGHIEYHNNSCRSRNCPNCQAVKKDLWVDKRRAEVIDSPYFHVVFTLPHELNPLLYHNQKLLYGLLHRCSAETLLELPAAKKYLETTPGIIQVLHTWNQALDYHVHMHYIVSGGGITPDWKIRKSSILLSNESDAVLETPMSMEPVCMVISGRNPFSLGVAVSIASNGTSANVTSLGTVFTHAVLAEVVASSYVS